MTVYCAAAAADDDDDDVFVYCLSVSCDVSV